MVYKPSEFVLNMISIYPYEKRLKAIERNIQNSDRINSQNKKLILEFKDECFANSIGIARIIRYLYSLRDLAVWLDKSFSVCEIKDLKTLVASIERMDKYCARTKVEYKASLKKFYKWLKGNDNPEEVAWIKLSLKKHNDKLPSELLSEQDITDMINKTTNLRDRAIIISLYESRCRIGEFLKMQIKDVTFDKFGALLDVTGKTGGRRVRVVTSYLYLMEWINRHPDKDNPNSFLWTKHNTKLMMSYPAICKALRTAKDKAEIKKKVNPHNFRHSRATYLANKLTEQQLKIFFGWTRGSDMASVYVHLSGRDVNNALLEIYGIKTKDKEEISTQLKIAKCFK